MLGASEVESRVGKLLTPSRAWVFYLLFGGAYAALFLLGVYTATNSVLALVWPANAFMIGMLVRFPMLARAAGWIACLVGFEIALLLLGFSLSTGARLTIFNFGIVVVGYALLSSFDRTDQRLERPTSAFYLFSAALAASIYSSIVGTLLVGPLFSPMAAERTFRYWFSVELLNQLAFLPMILAFPVDRQWTRELPLTLHDQAPIIVLVLSAVAGIFFGGLAAFVFPVPALLWCAISYRVFLTALLTFAFCAWAITATSLGYIFVLNLSQAPVLSISMGGALITLGPLIISTTTATRNEVLDQLRYLAAEREIVSSELEHRIKNLFALVNGLISLSVRDNPEMKPLANKLRHRLVALQHAHSLIRVRNAPTGGGDRTSLKELIGVLLRPYEGGKGHRRFAVKGDDALVDAGIVSPLALVFHELATNSTKYGALSDAEGFLEIHIRRGAEELQIDWSERAPGLSGQPETLKGGYGSKLLDLIVKSQLRGNYSRSWSKNRMDVEITLPAKLFPSVPREPGELA